MKFNNLFRTKDIFQTHSLDTNRYVLTDLRKHLTSCHILMKDIDHLTIKSKKRVYLFIYIVHLEKELKSYKHIHNSMIKRDR